MDEKDYFPSIFDRNGEPEKKEENGQDSVKKPGDTPEAVDVPAVDLEEIRRAIEGVAKCSDTSVDGGPKFKNTLRDHLYSLSHGLFSGYHQLVSKFYYEAEKQAKKALVDFEKKEKQTRILRGEISVCDAMISRSGLIGMLFFFHKRAAERKKPDLLIELDRIEPSMNDAQKKLEKLEGERDRLLEKSDIWLGYKNQAEGQVLSFGKISELVRRLKEGEGDIPKVDHYAFLAENKDLVDTIEKIIVFMEIKAKEISARTVTTEIKQVKTDEGVNVKEAPSVIEAIPPSLVLDEEAIPPSLVLDEEAIPPSLVLDEEAIPPSLVLDEEEDDDTEVAIHPKTRIRKPDYNNLPTVTPALEQETSQQNEDDKPHDNDGTCHNTDELVVDEGAQEEDRSALMTEINNHLENEMEKQKRETERRALETERAGLCCLLFKELSLQFGQRALDLENRNVNHKNRHKSLSDEVKKLSDTKKGFENDIHSCGFLGYFRKQKMLKELPCVENNLLDRRERIKNLEGVMHENNSMGGMLRSNQTNWSEIATKLIDPQAEIPDDLLITKWKMFEAVIASQKAFRAFAEDQMETIERVRVLFGDGIKAPPLDGDRDANAA